VLAGINKKFIVPDPIRLIKVDFVVPAVL
jgi:hypothetical protein